MSDDEQPGVPEWVVTFGDMMALLLTFFIMLVSMSEVNQDERYQAMLESMREQFGGSITSASLQAGEKLPTDPTLQPLASLGRAKRADIVTGGARRGNLAGDAPRVATIRPEHAPTAGALVYFGEASNELDDDARVRLRDIAAQIAGKPQTVEVRGHASTRPINGDDHWRIAYDRARVVVDALVAEGIDPARIRIGSSGKNDSLEGGVGDGKRRRNARVEVLLWDGYPGE
jgi:chemotaxis protein MotB